MGATLKGKYRQKDHKQKMKEGALIAFWLFYEQAEVYEKNIYIGIVYKMGMFNGSYLEKNEKFTELPL